MINRVLIRIRVIQILYSCYQNGSGDLKKAENELLFSFQKSYDLYFYLLSLMVELTEGYEKRIEARKAKLLPTEEEKNPNTKLLENGFLNQLKKNKEFLDYLDHRPMSWEEHDAYIKALLNNILTSDIYKEYISSTESSYEQDREFWRKVFKQMICTDEDLYNILEDDSLFWNDDIEIVCSFIIKTIKKFEEQNGENQVLVPMFRDDEDREFAIKLLRESMFNVKKCRDLIAGYAKNWESERIAFMDQIIMQVAITEIETFPSIPVNVTLNEFIDIAKAYSTNKSASFINGILDSIVNDLRAEKKILK